MSRESTWVMPASLLKKITLYSRSLAHETYCILMLWCIYRKALIHKWCNGILTYPQWCHFAVKFSVSLLCHLTTNCALFRSAAVLPDKPKVAWNRNIDLLHPFPKQVNHLCSFYLVQTQLVKLIEISIWKLYLLLFGWNWQGIQCVKGKQECKSRNMGSVTLQVLFP